MGECGVGFLLAVRSETERDGVELRRRVWEREQVWVEEEAERSVGVRRDMLAVGGRRRRSRAGR
jgi:hypothetical protein